MLLSLSVSDFGVGVLGQSLHISLLIKWLQQSNAGCNIHLAFVITLSLFSLVFLLSVARPSV